MRIKELERALTEHVFATDQLIFKTMISVGISKTKFIFLPWSITNIFLESCQRVFL